MIYLDAAATTPVRREVLEAMWPYLAGEFGNPSSTHSLGDRAARALAQARSTVADWLGCRASEIAFTSGGTEADNLAVKGIALGAPRGRHVVVSAIEHPAVMSSVEYLERVHGFSVTVLPVDAGGLVSPDDLADALRDDTTLVSVMLANNEIGTVQPIQSLAAVAHDRGVPFHTDAVQAAGWLPLDVGALGVDALTLSGHKLGAPKGIGVAYVRGRLPVEPVLHGGGQERGRRSGTENVAFAVGLARAVTLPPLDSASSVSDAASGVAALRDDFIARVLATVPGAVLTGDPVHRLPSVASFCFPGTSGESVLLQLEERDVVVSSGSACAAGSDDPSPVLLACGYPPAVAQTAVRFTFTHETTAADLAAAADALRASVVAVTSLGSPRP
ncbi:cysteine desulfurase [Cnuibacter physcomitrellae]|uniref:cysteine desulfurase n=1 Tax=Cnuibacter physcomitrellae TaxID=1619308 RepID=A0A1X9LN67_9MICO|nr:cysteine desulfurase family protein [Cnuibacter physcomitrellae]ARJ06636.1 cysteine desulfurase [Cnuibacter physcomitrellae]GGI38475.1 cysteine desulfurase [Cnuibacter physcomitrellae]